MNVIELPLGVLHRAPWNANRVPDDVMRKIARSLEEFGIVENLVVRPRPNGDEGYEVISGNHRLTLYAEAGMRTAPCHVVEVDDAHARVLAQTLNRTRGYDDPEAYARLLEVVLAELDTDTVIAFLPETEESIREALAYGLKQPPADRGELLALADVSLGDPRHQAERHELWELGHHLLAVEDVYAGWPTWAPLLAEGMLFVPYPTPTLTLTRRAEANPLLLVQPDTWLAGHCIDKYAAVHGDDTVSRR